MTNEFPNHNDQLNIGYWSFIGHSGLVIGISIISLALLITLPAHAQPAGLDSLTDDRLMNELALRGLDTLLNRAFDANHIPTSEQDGRRAILNLQKLADPATKLSASQRQELISKIAAGIDRALPAMRDPQALLQLAGAMVEQGVSRDVNTLEYWGDNLTVMSRLKPVAETTGKLYDRAAELAAQRVNQISAQITGPNNALMPELEKSDELQNLATYSARMNDYAIALSLDPADPQRKQVADTAIQYLQSLDTEDQPVRAQVHLRIAKLKVVEADYDAARSLLDQMTKPDFKPAPAVAQAYEARYFRAVVEVLDKKIDAAKKLLADLLTWQQTNLPPDKASQDGAAAAAAILEYRIDSLQADLAADDKSQTDFNTAARKVLLQLQADHPEFRAIISDLIIARLPEDAPMTGLDPLMLDALVRRGVVEAERPATDQADTKTLNRAVAAATELLKRTDADPQSSENAAFVLGYFYQRLGSDVDSINAFLDYVDHHPATERAPVAMQNAEAGIVKAKKTGVEDARLGEAYDRFLPLAIAPPYNRSALALEYARRLQLQGKPANAIKYFQQVPPDDKRQLARNYYQMIATKQLLDQLAPSDANRKPLARDIQSLADQVNTLAAADSSESAKSMIVRTKLLAAELARTEQKDPTRALSLLENFQSDVQGLASANSLLSEALMIRVQSLMALGKNNDAANALKTLLKTREGGQGAAIVYSLLVKLDADFDKAQQAGDKQSMRTLALSRASLSGDLVDWAKNNPDPRIKKFAYRYSVYEADTKHRAAEVETDPTQQKQLYADALKLYQNLQSPENLAAYKETLSPAEQASATYDPAVQRGIAMLQFDLGNYTESQKLLATLLKDGRLGSPLQDITQDGEPRTIDNDAYWEAVLKLIRSNLKLNADPDSQKTYLKSLYIRWGDHVGGKKWKEDFAKLKTELIPDFTPPSLK
jgi:hypothetical protein